MFAFPRRSQSFIIRVWIEPREIEEEAVVWRGVVEAVDDSTPPGDTPSRKAFRNLDELLEFLASRIQDMGVPPDQLRSQKP